MRNVPDVSFSTKPSDLELDALLHPAHAFGHPQDVIDDPELTLDEKRAVLASWASDACAVEASPALRRAPGSQRTVSVDDILEALRTLDLLSRDQSLSWAKRQIRRAAFEAFRQSRAERDSGGHPRFRAS